MNQPARSRGLPIVLKGDIAMRENSGKNEVVGSVTTESMISSGTHEYTCPPLVKFCRLRSVSNIVYPAAFLWLKPPSHVQGSHSSD